MIKVVCISSKFTNRNFTEVENDSYVTEYIMDDNGLITYYHFSVRLNFMPLKENRKEKLRKLNAI